MFHQLGFSHTIILLLTFLLLQSVCGLINPSLKLKSNIKGIKQVAGGVKQSSSSKIIDPINKYASQANEPTNRNNPFHYPMGVGPVLFNDCLDEKYTASDLCFNSKIEVPKKTSCNNLLEAASFVGAGFDARKSYSIENRKSNLIQRKCLLRSSFLGSKVPDKMSCFGVYDTQFETKYFSSVDNYMAYIRAKAGVRSDTTLFKDEADKMLTIFSYGKERDKRQKTEDNLPETGYVGTLANIKNVKESTIKKKPQPTQYIAVLTINIVLYQITLNEVSPNDIEFVFLKDFVDLPNFKFELHSGDDRNKYRTFLERWGTHYIKSTKVGGQLKIIKTSNAKFGKNWSFSKFCRQSEQEFDYLLGGLELNKPFYMRKHYGFKRFKGASKFTQTHVQIIGGDPSLSSRILDYQNLRSKHVFNSWIKSVLVHPKPIEFTLRSVLELVNLNQQELFPYGADIDFGCLNPRLPKAARSGKRYYTINLKENIGSKTVYKERTITCKFNTVHQFMDDFTARTSNLEQAMTFFIADGSSFSSDFELQGGDFGCDIERNFYQSINSKQRYPTWRSMKQSKFGILFDLPQEIDNVLRKNERLIVEYAYNRWFSFSNEPVNTHLYSGCKITDSKTKQICVRNILMTYNERNGLLQVTNKDFLISKSLNPNLPNWLNGATIGQTFYEQRKTNPIYTPCLIKWENFYSLNLKSGKNCLSFSAATKGSIFVIFATSLKVKSTWYYVRINSDGVEFYDGSTLDKKIADPNMNSLGNAHIFESFYICLHQVKEKVRISVHTKNKTSGYTHIYRQGSSSVLFFYAFGSGSENISFRNVKH